DGVQPALETFDVRRQENPPTREQGADRPGRLQDRGVQQRSAVEQTDWHQLEEDRFAAGIAEILYKAAHARAFERLVVVAPPRILGELRRAFHPEVEARIVGTLDKTLTNHPLDQIEKVLLAK
ncbi:MAG: host attachment family protein, partial [Tistlia sp.]